MRRNCGSPRGGSSSSRCCRGGLARYAARRPGPLSRSSLPYATQRPSVAAALPRSEETVAMRRGKPTRCDATHCAARRAIHGKTHAADRQGPEERVSFSRSSLDRFQHAGLSATKPRVGMLEKLLRDRQVNERRMDVEVAEIRSQVLETVLWVDSLAIPLGHPMDDERVPDIVNPWSTTAAARVHTGAADNILEQCPGGDLAVSAFFMHEQWRLYFLGSSRFTPGNEVVRQCGHGAGRQRQPARLEELGIAHVDGSCLQINVPEFQARDLSKTKSGAICHHQHRVH